MFWKILRPLHLFSWPLHMALAPLLVALAQALAPRKMLLFSRLSGIQSATLGDKGLHKRLAKGLRYKELKMFIIIFNRPRKMWPVGNFNTYYRLIRIALPKITKTKFLLFRLFLIFVILLTIIMNQT